jgi:hypothetical protein
MCAPSTVGEALAAVRDGLAFLNQAAVADLPGVVQADSLRELAKVESAYTAAHAGMLGAFSASGAHEDDGQQSERAWLKWQTQITKGAAAGAVGWMKRLQAHPPVRAALAAGAVSPSWARKICEWTDQLPEDIRDDADEILLAAAGEGAVLPDLAALAEEMRRRTAAPDPDGDGGFDERRVRLGLTFGGAGVLQGDLTPACAAALQAVLAALGKKAGPEDVRTAPQRRHDALEEACRRLIGADCLPDRAGQPTHIQLHLTLDQLRDMPGAADAEAAWLAAQAGAPAQPTCAATQAPTTGEPTSGAYATSTGQVGRNAAGARGAQAAQAATEGQPGWLTGRAAQGYACDAAIIPIVTGQVDQRALAALAGEIRATTRAGGPGQPASPAALARLHETLLRHAAGLLSGPGGLASFLRARLTGDQFPSASLPLDTGTPTSLISGALRRAVIARDRRCAFPGCDQPPAACQVHHLTPRAHGGETRLSNLVLLCAFHHLIAVHQWGWTLTLHADGTIIAVSPDRSRTLHSHGPPSRAA